MTQKPRKRKTATKPEGFKAHYYRGGGRSTRENISFWKTGFAVLGIGVLITAVWIFGRIRTVEVNGIENTEIKMAIKKQIHQEYTFLWQPYIGASQAALTYPSKVADVDIAVVWTEQRIIATAEVRRPALLWKTGGRVFTLDGNGVVIETVESAGKLEIPVVHDVSDLPVEKGSNVVPEHFVSFATQISESDLPITRLRIIDTTSELYADLETGYYVRFDTTGSARSQLENAFRVRDMAASHNRPIDHYIDVRIPYKAFYK